VLIEHSDTEDQAHATALLESLLGRAMERGLVDDAAFASTIEQANAMWHVRESIPLAQSKEGANVKHDIALPVSAIDEFVAATDAALVAAFPGVRLVDFGHLGDGNLHYNVQCPEGDDAHEFLRHEAEVNLIVYDAVGARNGSISAEHGIGALKARWLPLVRSAQERALFARIRSAFDPDGILNPHVLPR
jgi:FAD/FMN-containing dehydrogenase